MREKQKIVKLEQTCWACPSQWDAWTGEGKYIYIRYRYGCLTWRYDLRDSGQVAFESSDGWDGEMSQDEMKRHLSRWFEFAPGL